MVLLKRKIFSIVAIVALLVICFTCSCSAYWVGRGTYNYSFVPTPNSYSIHDSSLGYVHFGNANSNAGDISNMMTIGTTDYYYGNRNSGSINESTWLIENHTNSGVHFNRFEVTFPTISVNQQVSPHDVLIDLYFVHESEDSQYAIITYDYKISWVSADYSETENKHGNYSEYAYTKQSYLGSLKIPYHFNEADRNTYIDFVDYYQSPNDETHTELTFGIPSIYELSRFDDDLDDALLANQSANSRYYLDLTVHVRISDPTVGNKSGISTISTYSNNTAGYYSAYDPVNTPLIEEDLSIRVANNFNLFGFIIDAFNGVMSIEIAGVTLGDILGICLTLLIVVIVLKVFAGG